MKMYEVVLYDKTQKLPGLQTIKILASNKLIAKLKIKHLCRKNQLKIVCWNPCIQFDNRFNKYLDKETKIAKEKENKC